LLVGCFQAKVMPELEPETKVGASKPLGSTQAMIVFSRLSSV